MMIRKVFSAYFNRAIFGKMRNTVNFDEIKAMANDPSVWIVDVRNPDEVFSTGGIGNCINIPATNVSEALKDHESFKDKFGRAVPTHEDTVIFYCRSGKRAQKAWEDANALGFQNAKYYPGSYLEWSSKQSEN
ncbi:unnamed protein product [Phyllotreta striolata]|uniref:Rhodanese domain-containing protein n=1 Tax=Phyllotreta striolata TaxID=444603 RepID=A0A9N9XQ09_PHYSR|nr:unnamed protein product [Phyllotreta striolata]